jgi:hypothetical protein
MNLVRLDQMQIYKEKHNKYNKKQRQKVKKTAIFIIIR